MANFDEIDEDKNSYNGFKYVLCFCIFFIIGGVLGIILTTKYLEMQDEDGNNLNSSESTNSIDITNDKDYESTIETLNSIVSSDPLFYNSNGINVSNIDREKLLSFIYNYLSHSEKLADTTLYNSYWGSNVCEHDFLVSTETNDDGSTYSLGVCELKVLNFSDVNDIAKKIFGVDSVDNSADFMVNTNTKCVLNGESYLCGSVSSAENITGELTPKFEIQKVTKEDDGSIIIYDKGYLVDTRSNVVNPNDGYDNYYLHSSDSTAYYYELKSADNYIFKHTFKMDANRNYYYYSSEVVK